MKKVHEIEIKLEGENWSNCLDKAFKKANKDIKIDGFRKGTAPKDVYLKKYGIESLYNEAINEAINIAYKELLDKNDLVPVVEPQVDVTGISDGSVIFKFKIITKPEVKLSSYKNLGVKKDKVKVTKEEINEEIDRLRSRFAEVVLKESGEVVKGNTAIIDFDGYVDGKQLEGGKGENYPLEIGSNTFIPGFEEGLIGMKKGEEKELNLKFPENYTEELKNKDVTFKVKVNEIKERILPEINKDFYADLGYNDIKTEEEFNKKVEEEIKHRKEHEVEDKYLNECVDKAISNMKVEINEEIIHDEVHRMMHQAEEQFKMQGITLEQYLGFTGMTMEDFHKQAEPEAKKRVQERYLLEEVAKQEKIDFTDKEVDEEAEKIAKNYGLTKEELITEFGGIEVVKYDMKMRKALEVLKGE